MYHAHAFAPQTGAKTHQGTLRVESGFIVFDSPTAPGRLPFSDATIRRGGHNNEQIFFEHPRFPGWSIYSSDPALLKDPALLADPRFARLARGVEKTRKAVPFPVILALGLMTILFGGLVFLWLQKDRIVEYIARQIPISWEVSIGDQAFEQFRQSGQIVTNSSWAPHVASITSRLLPSVESTGYNFRFHIMQDTNVNAFAMPGGNVVILTGLLEQAENGEEVAGVLAHEIAHVTHRHSLRNIIKSAGLIIFIQAAFGDMSGLAGVAVEGSRYLLQQKFSRDFEREADDAGWTYLLAGEIDPRGMTRFFGKLKEMAAAQGAEAMEGALSLLSTHPASVERIERLEKKWRETENKDGFKPLPRWPATME
jgi:beta-barrel assembly-enhancing protease